MRPDEAAELEILYTYHPPEVDQIALYEGLRRKGKELATLILETAPASRERSLAHTKLEEAIMWANAAIARRS